MVILHEHKTVIICPPRCASHALHKRFSRVSRHTHGSAIPVEHSDWNKLIIVRNPFRRLESLYRLHHKRVPGDYHNFLPATKKTFPPLHWYHDQCPDAHPIKLESLKEGLEQHGLPSDVPVFFSSTERRVLEPDATIREWAKTDCDRYGYEME